ncbi:hypothetical protein [uncultured Mameliella sp.]|uniref:hypothetical protein n=1 Tax=uncultured Mameliella sp. TaxID=1447087 RepID=UPI00261A67DF|nr:hypothetical protein [uncultured Mameliella sp.]
MRYFFWAVVLSAILFPVGFWMYVVSGVVYESRTSMASRFFPNIVMRAIRMERLGVMGLPDGRIARAGVYSGYPWQWIAAREKFSKVSSGRVDVDCSFEVALPELDLTRHDPSIGFLLSYRPFRYVVFFEGKVPDIASIFGEGLDKNLSAVPYFRNDVRGGNRIDPKHYALDPYRKVLYGAYKSGFVWSGVECPGYSFVIFEEK